MEPVASSIQPVVPRSAHEHLTSATRVRGDGVSGYFWMAPAGMVECLLCGWREREWHGFEEGTDCTRIRRLKTRPRRAGEVSSNSRYTGGRGGYAWDGLARSWAVRYAEWEDESKGLAMDRCAGRMYTCFHFMERLGAAGLDEYMAGLCWAKGRGGTEEAWRRWFTPEGAAERRPVAIG